MTNECAFSPSSVVLGGGFGCSTPRGVRPRLYVFRPIRIASVEFQVAEGIRAKSLINAGVRRPSRRGKPTHHKI